MGRRNRNRHKAPNPTQKPNRRAEKRAAGRAGKQAAQEAAARQRREAVEEAKAKEHGMNGAYLFISTDMAELNDSIINQEQSTGLLI